MGATTNSKITTAGSQHFATTLLKSFKIFLSDKFYNLS